ncbi:hypothetical protein CJU89_4229 [Yarrowia sp. B02]|nr:hypothetical protein CJU89_4229 [Yarrowia sp. B02]
MTDKVIQYYEHYYDRSRDLEALATYVASHYTHNMPIIIGTLCCMLFVCSYVLHDIITESKEVESDEKELPLPVAKPRQSLFRDFSFDSHKEYVNDEVDPLTTLEELQQMEDERRKKKEQILEQKTQLLEQKTQILDPVHSFKQPYAQYAQEPWENQWPEPQITLLEALA